MGLGFNNNYIGINLTRQIGQSHYRMVHSMEKLASGLAINRAADDPAGLVISERMRARLAGLNQEIENVSNQINRYQTADSALLQMRGQLTEMRTLALAAANDGGLDESARQAYQDEVDHLADSYNTTRDNTQFGTQALLDGSDGSVAAVETLAAPDLSDAEAAVEAIDAEIEKLDRTLSGVGATQKYGLESRLSSLRVEAQNVTAAESQIRDLDYALEFSNFIREKIMFQAGMSLMAHSYMSPQVVLSLLSGS